MKTERKQTAAEARAEYEAWFNAQVRLGLEDIEEAGRVVGDAAATEHMRQLRDKLRAGEELARAA